MLAESTFYKIISKNHLNDGAFSCTLLINEKHEIFTGHFPDLPIVPGVCTMQMIKELLEQHLQKKLRLITAGNLKFLSIINPVENPEIEIQISYASNDDGFIHADS